MSKLEAVAQRALTPFILGEPGQIAAEDLGAVAAWAHKTALTAMLVSSEQERADGYGLPPSEYQELYAIREQMQPPPVSRFWIGRCTGRRSASVRVTPLAVGVEDVPQADRPQGYAMTVLLGQLLIHGARFTTPALETDLATRHELPQLWPGENPISWPGGRVLDDVEFFAFVGGRDLVPIEQYVVVEPWKKATELDESQVNGDLVELPLICGKHVAYYPLALVGEAAHGHFYTFATSCECPMAYLIQTEPDGAHCKAAGPPDAITDRYEALDCEELEIHDRNGVFFCKRVERDRHP